MAEYSTTIGIDLGDKWHQFCVLDAKGNVAEEGRIGATMTCMENFLRGRRPARFALEAGTHSPWMSRVIASAGHEVLVGNPRKLAMIWASEAKSDRRDALMLARVARLDPALLSPVTHRGEQAQADLALIKARDGLVRARSSLISQVRGIVKSHGHRLTGCSGDSFAKKAAKELPEILRPALEPLVAMAGKMTLEIKGYDKKIEALSQENYPETSRLQQIKGVGPITSLAYVLKLEEADRFKKSRTVGRYFGLTPRRDQSGEVDKQLGICKAGDDLLRRLLVNCAHYVLNKKAPDTALQRWGRALAARGGKRGRKRAAVAVARKLAVILHRLWQSGQDYEAFPEVKAGRRRSRQRAQAA